MGRSVLRPYGARISRGGRVGERPQAKAPATVRGRYTCRSMDLARCSWLVIWTIWHDRGDAFGLRGKRRVRILAARPGEGAAVGSRQTLNPGLANLACRSVAGQIVERLGAVRSICQGDPCMPLAPAPEEMNVYQNAEARFEVAAGKLGLEPGLFRDP